ncbi:hypothetical protein L1987_44003 [Smallanthus sonchifolius]|uniref:Uncharacterized protein n=1 Tax=Smallanthus sonchifolius TaxID=185202 RepID=A0ACB9GPI8_9ASTR|nr:hypothetical protein L1987_44003 [Smallanthus sonchifolius]
MLGMRTQYMNTIFSMYNVFGFLVLHMLMHAGNVYFWTRYRVNYSFIFGFKPATGLGFKEVLLLGSGLSVLTLAAVLSNLEMDLDPKPQSYKALTELLLMVLVIVRLHMERRAHYLTYRVVVVVHKQAPCSQNESICQARSPKYGRFISFGGDAP